MGNFLPPPRVVSPKGRVLFALLSAAGWGYHRLRVAWRLASSGKPEKIRRILAVRQSLLGDTVVFLPTLAALRTLYPGARIVLGVQPGMSSGFLLDGCRDVDEIRELHFLSHPSALARLWGALRLFLEGFDLVISGTRYFLIREAFFSGAPHRIGLDDGVPLQALNNRTIRFDPTRHESDNNLALVELLGARVEPAARSPTLRLEAEPARQAAEELLMRTGVPRGAPIVTIHPGAQKPSRRWPAERFSALAARMLAERPELWVLFTGTPGEAELVESIRCALPAGLAERAPSLIGQTDLSTLLGVFDLSTVFVCNDTGVMHLARARGTPLVALLGPENDLRWGPYPTGSAPAISLRYEVPCAPCSRWDCEGFFCLRSLEPAEVADAVSQLLDADPHSHLTDPQMMSSGDPSVTLTRRNVRRSWRELAEAGLSPPLVTVVVPPAADLGVPADVLHQDYPYIEVVRLDGMPGAPSELKSSDASGATSVGSVPVDAAAAWRALLDAAAGEILVFHRRSALWSAGQISADVAALFRNPEADAAIHRSAPGPSGAAGTIPIDDGVAVRKTWLAARVSDGALPDNLGGEERMLEWLRVQLQDATRADADLPVAAGEAESLAAAGLSRPAQPGSQPPVRVGASANGGASPKAASVIGPPASAPESGSKRGKHRLPTGP